MDECERGIVNCLCVDSQNEIGNLPNGNSKNQRNKQMDNKTTNRIGLLIDTSMFTVVLGQGQIVRSMFIGGEVLYKIFWCGVCIALLIYIAIL